MGIFTGRKSVAIDSPRHLTLRHARRTVVLAKRELNILAADEDIPDPPLKPGEEQLHSYWAPALEAGPTYDVQLTQTVTSPDPGPPLDPLVGHQRLTVDAPQFVLPADAIHSIYPPAGYSEDHRILPHVVLTDPHLPWERLSGPRPDPLKRPRNLTPWLALLVFEQDELRLSPDVLDGTNSIFAGTSPALARPVKQTATLTVRMTVADALATTKTATPFAGLQLSDAAKSTAAEFIFIKPDIFTSLFSPFDAQGKRQPQTKAQTGSYQYMSHVRNINTAGMALAGVEDNGIFSIVISPRCGPIDNQAPVGVSAHLVSIEGVEDMNMPISQEHVALCSLYSWNYTVLPAGQIGVEELFQDLGNTLGVLRPPDAVITPFEGRPGDQVSTRIAHRMRDGYSLMKYYTQTGEPTVAFFRGPFTPNVVAPIPQLNQCSNSGVDFQILDKELGIMDITYSSAWQMGRSLALADAAFATALGRLRTAIQSMALKASKIQVLQDISPNSFRTRDDVLSTLARTVQGLNDVQSADSELTETPFVPGGPLKRWHRPILKKSEFPQLSFSSPLIAEKYQANANAAARELAKATDGNIYDETNNPVSSDWMVVLAWVMSRMFLDGVPAHYLITDPSHLPAERLQFFYIDPNWVDAMIDGALSLGNHMGNDKDRVAIKIALNDYIRSKPELQPHAPQIPTYGFLLRSDVVSRFPDLKVETLPPQPDPPVRAPLLRHNIVADGVMLALLDRVPNSTEFSGLVFTQPPHQQRFVVGSDITTKDIRTAIRRQYTVDAIIRGGDANRHKPLDLPSGYLPSKPSDNDNIMIWGSTPGLDDLHMLRLPRFADLQQAALHDYMGEYDDAGIKKPYFKDTASSSALFAMQLNDPVYQLVISLDKTSALNTLVQLPQVPAVLAATISSTQAIRTLRALEPSTISKTTAEDSSSDDETESDTADAPDHDALIAMATYERPATMSSEVAAARDLAPHVKALPCISMATLPHIPTSYISPDVVGIAAAAAVGDSPLGPNDPANLPDFQCKIYSARSQAAVAEVHVTADGPPQDLIVKVHVDNTQHSGYKLKEFQIWLQLNAVDPDKPNCLLTTYTGSGATMLSNLRFNVLAAKVVDGSIPYLLLRVLPRAAIGWIAAPKMGKGADSEIGVDVDFLLGMASPNLFPDRIAVVAVKTVGIYDGVKNQQTGSFSVTVINDSIS